MGETIEQHLKQCREAKARHEAAALRWREMGESSTGRSGITSGARLRYSSISS